MKLNKVLFVGTGGGNDIFSTLLAVLSLRRHMSWKECAIAGVLSPFHFHTVVEGPVPYVFRVSPETERFVPRDDGAIKIGFIDAVVAKLVRENRDLDITDVFGLSLSAGSKGLESAFRELSKVYDQIILVDVGGDIFYRGRIDKRVLSPMFDAIVLRAFVDSGANGFLFEAGPGTDGELEPRALDEILATLSDAESPIHEEDMDEWESLYKSFIAPVRTGNTVPRTIEAYRSKEDTLVRTFKVRSHVGDKRIYSAFSHTIYANLAKRFFIIDPKEISNPFAVSCDNPIDWFRKTQCAIGPTNCEANLEFLRVGRSTRQFITPSPLFTEDERMTLIRWSLEGLLDGSCDSAIMYPDDFDALPEAMKGKLKVVAYNELVNLIA